MSGVITALRVFGEVRREDGDTFEEFPQLPGHFFYSTGDARTGRDLANADGSALTAPGVSGMMALTSWWETHDARINELLTSS